MIQSDHPAGKRARIAAVVERDTEVVEPCCYTGGSALLLVCLFTVLGLWYRSEGTISVNTVTTPKVEAFYWTAITFSQTLGTALGDWVADTGGLGYQGGALVFAAGLAVIGGLYLWTNVSRAWLFWSAFILTRPLGATVGDGKGWSLRLREGRGEAKAGAFAYDGKMALRSVRLGLSVKRYH